jgi:CBS domain containing-hemolysin-like protein
MSSDNPASETPRKQGLIRNIARRFRRGRDVGLRAGLESVIETHQAESGGGDVARETTSMMRNLITFSELRVDDVMVPRADIIAIEDTASMRDLLTRFKEANHSRLPIYRETLDEVTGMVHVKDFMRWMTVTGAKRKSQTKTSSITVPAADLAMTIRQANLHREVLYVPPSMPAADLLVKMQASHIHLAIVVDEYGGSDGLVSIEDLVEEIVGDISDEHDTEEEAKLIKRLNEKTYVADARVEIATVDRLLNVDLLSDEEEDEADTLGGLIFEMAGRVPARGEVIRHSSGLEFEILQSDPRRVKRIRIHVKPKDEPAADETASESGA